MELSYTTNASDYLALLQHHLERSVLGKRFVYFAWIAIASLAWMSVLLPYLKFGVIDLWVILRTALATGITFGFPFLYRWYNERVFGQLINERSVQGIAGPTLLVATSEVIEHRTKMTTTRASWQDVSGIVSTPQHDFISLAPLVTIMVPATAFPEREARVAFQAQLNKWRASAKPLSGRADT
ncbi:MAG: hypothetical protein H7X91_02900 [Burkholderiales bacterium]|nr:hypothetical protein [Burkholderiales bacterium]